MAGRYHGIPETDWPTLRHTERLTLAAIADRNVAVVWLADKEFPSLGYKPWYSITGGARPDTLHRLWLDRLIRMDRSTVSYRIHRSDGKPPDMEIGRARLTPLGRRVLDAC